MINLEKVENIAQSIARTTGSKVEKGSINENEDEIQVDFYHYNLKIGGEDDNDGNSDEVWSIIIDKVKRFMQNYPDIKYSVESSEKGYWFMTFKKERSQPLRKDEKIINGKIKRKEGKTFSVILKRHDDNKIREEIVILSNEEMKKFGDDIDDYIAGTFGIIWDKYDRKEYYVDSIFQYRR